VQLQSRLGTTGAFSTVYAQEYTPAYSAVTRTDSLRLNYTVPSDATAGTRIRVKARVTNVDLADYPRTAGIDLVVVP